MDVYILCPHVTYYSTTHNTNIHAPGGIRTRNPTSDLPQTPCSAAGTGRGFVPLTDQPEVSRYTD